MPIVDALRKDARTAEKIACDMGEHLRDDPKQTIVERCIWALAVGQLHIIEWIIRRERHEP